MEKEGMNKTVVFKSILWLCLGIIFILPVFLIIMNAFKPNNDILTSFISFPKSLYLENFSEAMRIMNFWTVFRNTLFVTVCTVIVASAVSFMSAYGISHLPQKKGDKLYTLFVVGQIIPFHAVMIAISMLSTKLGLTKLTIEVAAREDYRLFKLNRMDCVTESEQFFMCRNVPMPNLSNEKIFPGGIKVKVLFAPDVKWRLVEEFGPHCFTRTDDGRLLFSADYTDMENLVTWLMTFGAKAEVLEPKEARDIIRRNAEETLKSYGGLGK